MFGFFKEKRVAASAGEAKERLQVMIATQRVAVGDGRGSSSIDERLLYKIQAEIMLVLEKYVSINRDNMKVEVSQVDSNTEVLEVTIPIGDEKISL